MKDEVIDKTKRIDTIDDDEEENNPTSSSIQLGFSIPINDKNNNAEFVGHRSHQWWNDWDGGQIGGKPTWLQPKDIPGPLQCGHCHLYSMRFICQFYAPLDSIEEDDDDEDNSSFHRSFYIFACPNRDCYYSCLGSVRVVRVQLPRKNEFYPYSEEESTTVWNQHLPTTHGVTVCKLCGLRGKGKCPIQKESFCCKDHQKEYKKYIFDTNKKPSATPSVYMETELVVEEEPPPISRGNANLQKNKNDMKKIKQMFPSNNNNNDDDDDDDDDEDDDDDDDDGDEKGKTKQNGDDDENDKDYDSDEHLEQEDLNEIVTGTAATSSLISKDVVTMKFYSRILDEHKNVSQQCLRYNCHWQTLRTNYYSSNGCGEEQQEHSPLWIRSDYRPDSNQIQIPNCQYCGSPRKFEFQLMPQMLHYLIQKQNNNKQDGQDASSSNDKFVKAKLALMQANSIIEQAPPEQIPPSLVDEKIKTINILKKQLDIETSATTTEKKATTPSDSATNHDSSNIGDVDWGVIAIYTCLKSCNGSNNNNNNGKQVDNDNKQKDSNDDDDGGYLSMASSSSLGCYLEEYAWKQPSLDL